MGLPSSDPRYGLAWILLPWDAHSYPMGPSARGREMLVAAPAPISTAAGSSLPLGFFLPRASD